ncbi:hypothetical protein [Streptococcus pneumoniae]|uniref:hypothetical protein n=1 Tax=Streptococcus pneumoniae TaxID=1313 RepID=UPI000B58F20D|nr:hypothetical protein [Streptococcus pneumoniae]SNI56473.1 N-ethylammeline chlorohydrolase [Streptococcus pneumoniae]
MKIKEQTRKLAAGCSKHCFEVMDELTKSVTPYGKAKLTWFERFSKEYKMMGKAGQLVFFDVYRLVR